MNEQMKSKLHKLADTCKHPDNYHQGPWMDYIQFAELIVRQMLEITDAHTEVFQTDRDRAVIEHIKQSVKTHFGVEDV